LVGFFARHTRKHIDGKVTEHPIEAITLCSDLSFDEINTFTKDDWERAADKHAVKYAKYSPFEKKWMVDWQMVPVEIHEERAA
jgi:hypothetical protein